MTNTVLTATNASPPGGAYSQGVAAAAPFRAIATAGQVGIDPATAALADTLAGQVSRAIANLAAVLEAAGASLADVVKTTCFLADIGDFDAFDAAYRAAFPRPWPARSTVGVDLAGGLLVEIEALAFVSEGAES